MRVAASPNFKKLYGKIDEDIIEDTVLTFKIGMYSDYSDFDAKKYIVISTVTSLGTYNSVLGWLFFVEAILSLLGMISVPVLYKLKRPPTAQEYFGFSA